MAQTPAGATLWIPTDESAHDLVPDAHDPSKKHAPVMFTSDLALKEDPIYAPISKRFHENPQEFAEEFAKAWYKLTHRDMGPRVRSLGPEVPKEPQLWQDPVPEGSALSDADGESLKAKALASGLSISQLVATAWASASTYRHRKKTGSQMILQSLPKQSLHLRKYSLTLVKGYLWLMSSLPVDVLQWRRRLRTLE